MVQKWRMKICQFPASGYSDNIDACFCASVGLVLCSGRAVTVFALCPYSYSVAKKH